MAVFAASDAVLVPSVKKCGPVPYGRGCRIEIPKNYQLLTARCLRVRFEVSVERVFRRVRATLGRRVYTEYFDA